MQARAKHTLITYIDTTGEEAFCVEEAELYTNWAVLGMI